MYFDVYENGLTAYAKNLSRLYLNYSAGGYTVNTDNDNTDTSRKSLNAVDTVILRYSKTTAADSEITVNVSSGTAKDTTNVRLKGLNIEERNKLLSKYESSIYFTKTSEERNILQVTDGQIYNGKTSVIDSDMNINQKIDYEIYTLQGTILDTAKTNPSIIQSSGNNTLNSRPLLGDSTAYFTINSDNKLVLNDNISLSSGNILVLFRTITYTDDTESREYYSFQQIIIPSDGIGGSEYSKYTSGDYFGDHFKQKDGYYTTSTDFTSATTNSEIFMINDPSIRDRITLTMAITKVDGDSSQEAIASVADFCQILKTTSDSDTYNAYKINIDISKAPAKDTDITVDATFTIADQSYRQPYTFTVPGIYRFSTDENDTNCIRDIWVYLRMLEVYGDRNGYLLVNDAQKTMAEFDCTKTKLDAIHNGTNELVNKKQYNLAYLVDCGIITQEQADEFNSSYGTTPRDLDGVQYLINTDKMSFDNNELKSVTPFKNAQITGMTLTDLSMENCKITDISALYNLNKLKTLNLNQNSITKIGGCIYRTVTELHLDNQTGFSALDDITTLPNLKKLYIQNNKINDFRVLSELSKLTDVYLGGNDFGVDSLYGTHGEINVSSYVAILVNKVNIYVDGTNKVTVLDENVDATAPILDANGYEITYKQNYLAVAINSIMYMSSYSSIECGDDKFPKVADGVESLYKLYEETYGTGTVIYTIDHSNMSIDADGVTYAVLTIKGSDKASKTTDETSVWYNDTTEVKRLISYKVN